MAELNCCLVGYGGIAAFHTDALRQLDGVELHTVVGRREEPPRAFQPEHGFGRATPAPEPALHS